MNQNKIAATLKIIKNELIREEELRYAAVFGSFALGKVKPNSDIDIGVAFKAPMSIDNIIKLSAKLSLESGREIDLIDLLAINGVI
jgi:uncharacterized protein